MRYSIEPKDKIYVKGYRFLSFAKNMCKNVNNKYGQKLLDGTKKCTTDAIKTASKRAIEKNHKQLAMWLLIPLLIKLQVFQKKISERITK